MKILPTHSCFDDCADYINALAREDPTYYDITYVKVCHGYCTGQLITANGDSKSGSYCHAWIFDAFKNIVIDFGIDDTTKKLVALEWPLAKFLEFRNVSYYYEYSLDQLARASQITHHSGPWNDELQQLCADANDIPRSFIPELRLLGTLRTIKDKP